VTILETPAMPPELPPPSKIDPGLEATRVALEAQLARNAIAAAQAWTALDSLPVAADPDA
jgi:hypothetical protein